FVFDDVEIDAVEVRGDARGLPLAAEAIFAADAEIVFAHEFVADVLRRAEPLRFHRRVRESGEHTRRRCVEAAFDGEAAVLGFAGSHCWSLFLAPGNMEK